MLTTSRLVRHALLVGAAALAAATLSSSLAGGAVTPTSTTSRARVPVRSVVAAPRKQIAPTPRNWGTARLVSVEALKVSSLRPTVTVQDAKHTRRRRPPPGPGTGGGCVNPGPGTNEYALDGYKVQGPRTMHFNVSTTPGGLFNVAGSLQAALSTWSSADSRAPQITVAADGATTSPTADHQDEAMFANLGASTLAITYTWQWSNGEVESDVALNAAAAWFQAPSEGSGCYAVAAYDVQNTLTHESGHVYGMAHANNSPGNTMYPSATPGETFKRSLAPGDVLGIQHIY